MKGLPYTGWKSYGFAHLEETLKQESVGHEFMFGGLDIQSQMEMHQMNMRQNLWYLTLLVSDNIFMFTQDCTYFTFSHITHPWLY
ncbi:hypothetical protein ACHQM5_010017 [Ranunculus cassubicifolius]